MMTDVSAAVVGRRVKPEISASVPNVGMSVDLETKSYSGEEDDGAEHLIALHLGGGL